MKRITKDSDKVLIGVNRNGEIVRRIPNWRNTVGLVNWIVDDASANYVCDGEDLIKLPE
jgi:hypothetical protein